MDKAKVRAKIVNLKYDWQQFTLSDFISHIERQRQRPIIQMEITGLLVTGLVLSLWDEDHIVVNGSAHPVARLHYKLHELGHILLDHVSPADYVTDEEMLHILCSFTQFRGNGTFLNASDEEQEREAEYFVNIIQDHIFQNRRLHELTQTEQAQEAHYPPLTKRYMKRGDKS